MEKYEKTFRAGASKILIAEDSDNIRLFLSKLLKKEGYNVLEASDGQMAIDIIMQNKDVNLVLLDLDLPKLSGTDILRRVSDIKAKRGFKICMLTVKNLTKKIRKCLSLGADDYIVKPADSRFLLEKINILLLGENNISFFRAACNSDGEILRADADNVKINLISLSELEVCFKSPIELPVKARIQLKANLLEKILKNPEPLIVRLYQCKKLDNYYCIKGVFIALSDEYIKRLRSATTKNLDMAS